MDANSEAYINTEQFTDYHSVEIELGFHHILSPKCGPVLNVRDAMEWLTETERADFQNIDENDCFVVKYWDLIEELAASDTTVRLFDRNGGKFVCFDVSAVTLFTQHFYYHLQIKSKRQHGEVWTLSLIFKEFGATSAFILTINNVQVAALISKTLIGEKQRTWRAISTSMIKRTFNILGVERRRNNKHNKKEFNGNRVKGSFGLHEKLLDGGEREGATGSRESRVFEAEHQGERQEGGSKELEQLCMEVQGEVKRKIVQYKGELAGGYKPAAHMDGKVFLSELLKVAGHEPILDDEIIVRKIPNNLKEWKDTIGIVAEDDIAQVMKELPWKEKKNFLKCDEAQREVENYKFKTFDEAFVETRAVEPVGDLLKQHLENQISNRNE